MAGKERMEKVLVTGATGFIGYEVAKQLSEKVSSPGYWCDGPSGA